MKFIYRDLANDFKDFLTVSMRNKKGFTNGKFIDFNEPPERLMKLKRILKMEKRKVIDIHGSQTKRLLNYVKEAEIKSTMETISMQEDTEVVQLIKGVFIKKLYWDYFRLHYPQTKFYTTKYGNRPIIVKNGRKIQGIIMPYVIEGRTIYGRK